MAHRFHCILDLKLDDNYPKDRKMQEEILHRWLHEIVDTIEMQILCGPYITEGKAEKEGQESGLTMLVGIDFSSITLHTFDQSNSCKIDIFSCKEYNPKFVELISTKYFGSNIRYKNWIVASD